MNEKVVLTGIGHISALGQGIQSLSAGLKKTITPKIINKPVMTAAGEKVILAYTVVDFELPTSVSDSVARRMSHLAKMCFTSVNEAVADCFKGRPYDPERVGLVVGTAFGTFDLANEFERRIQLDGQSGASPSLFASSVQNSIASQLTIAFNIQGPTATIMTMEQTALGSISLAYDWVRRKIVDHAIVVVAEEISEIQSYLLANQSVTSERLDPNSDLCTMIAGEGAVCFILSLNTNTEARSPYAEITDVSMRTDQIDQSNRHFYAGYGRKGQRSSYEQLLNTDAICHASLYGGLISGLAFEIAIATIQIGKDGLTTTCVQNTDHDESQSITLSKSAVKDA